ncbi:hypothetical protein U2436_02495 [Klebsiella pneumoniae]|uniref:hypothetical protein n=1 Tax=Klebsiella pneumoniae TaxID=573 RepID=UPI0037BFFFF2
MTKSTITREQLLEIIETDHVQCGEASYLARMALAAMDSEPVAWTWQHLKQWHVTNDEERARDLAWDGVKVEPLYRHTQPAPVVQLPQVEHIEQFGDVWSSYYQGYYLAEDVISALTTAGVKWSDAMLGGKE